MARGLRSSKLKANKTKLRARVFRPIEESRTQRLSQKLLELAQQPRPERTEMLLDSSSGKSSHIPLSAARVVADPSLDIAKTANAAKAEEMEVDETATHADSEGPTTSKSSARDTRDHRVHKRRQKPRNQIVFPRKAKHGGGGPGRVQKKRK